MLRGNWVGWRAGTCPVLKAERKNITTRAITHSSNCPTRGKNLPIGQGAHAGEGGWYRS